MHPDSLKIFHAWRSDIKIIFICIIFVECSRCLKYKLWQKQGESQAEASSGMLCVLVLWVYLFSYFFLNSRSVECPLQWESVQIYQVPYLSFSSASLLLCSHAPFSSFLYGWFYSLIEIYFFPPSYSLLAKKRKNWQVWSKGNHR